MVLPAPQRQSGRPGRVAWWSICGAICALLACAKGFPVAAATGILVPTILAVGGVPAAIVFAYLGAEGMVLAIRLGISAGGVDVLNKLRSYKEKDSQDNLLILSRY